MVATFSMSVGSREGEATLVLPFSSFAQSLNNAASPAAVGDRARASASAPPRR